MTHSGNTVKKRLGKPKCKQNPEIQKVLFTMESFNIILSKEIDELHKHCEKLDVDVVNLISKQVCLFLYVLVLSLTRMRSQKTANFTVF